MGWPPLFRNVPVIFVEHSQLGKWCEVVDGGEFQLTPPSLSLFSLAWLFALSVSAVLYFHFHCYSPSLPFLPEFHHFNRVGFCTYIWSQTVKVQNCLLLFICLYINVLFCRLTNIAVIGFYDVHHPKTDYMNSQVSHYSPLSTVNVGCA